MKAIVRHLAVLISCGLILFGGAYAQSAGSMGQAAFGSSSGKAKPSGDS